MRPTAIKRPSRSPNGQKQRERHAAQSVDPHGTGYRIRRHFVRLSLRIVIHRTCLWDGRSKHGLCQGWRGEGPHGEEREPTEKLDQPKLGHHWRHVRHERDNFSQPRLPLPFVIRRQRFRRVLGGGENRDQNACHEHECPNGKGHEHAVWQFSCSSFVGDPQLGDEPGQIRRDPCTDANDERLQHKPVASLLFWQLVRNQCPKRFHAHVDARIQHPQKACGHPQLAAVRHKEQGQGTQDCPDQKERTTPSPPRMPRVVTQVPNDGLNNQARQWCGDPKHGNFILARAQGLEDARHVAALQGKTELDAQKPKAHVPDFPEPQFPLFHRRRLGVMTDPLAVFVCNIH